MARYKEFKRRTYRAWYKHVAAAHAAGVQAAGPSGLPVRPGSLPEKWSDDIDFHGTVNLEALSRGAAAAGGAPGTAAMAGFPTAPQPFPTSDPLLAGLCSGATDGGRDRSVGRTALGTISSHAAARSHRPSGDPEEGAAAGDGLDANVRNVLAGSGLAVPAQAAGLLGGGLQRGGGPAGNFRSLAPQQLTAAPASAPQSSVGGVAPTTAASNARIAIYMDDEGAPSAPAPPKHLAQLGGSVPAVTSQQPAPLGDAPPGAAASWKVLPRDGEMRKENSQAATRWTDGGLPKHEGVASLAAADRNVGARPAASAVRDSRVAVWADDAEVQQTPGVVATRAPAPAPAVAPAPSAMRLRQLEAQPASSRPTLAPPAPTPAALSQPSSAAAKTASVTSVMPIASRQPVGTAASAEPEGAGESGGFDQAFSCEERRAQAWLARCSKANPDLHAAILSNTADSVAKRIAAAAGVRTVRPSRVSQDRTARLSSIHQLLGGAGDDSSVMQLDEEVEENGVSSKAAPSNVVPAAPSRLAQAQPVGRAAPAPAPAPAAPFALYEDSFIDEHQPLSAHTRPQQQFQQQLQQPAGGRGASAPATGIGAGRFGPASYLASSSSSHTGLFSSDLSGIVAIAGDDSIQPGALAFVPLRSAMAMASVGGASRAPQAQQQSVLPAAVSHRPQPGHLSVIQELPSSLSHSSYAVSSVGTTTTTTSASLSSLEGTRVGALSARAGAPVGGSIPIFLDESLVAEGRGTRPAAQARPGLSQASAGVGPRGLAVRAPSEDAENVPAAVALHRKAALRLTTVTAPADLFEPAPRSPRRMAVASPRAAHGIPAAVRVAVDEDVTINTRLAMDDVGGLFASPSLARVRSATASAARTVATAPAPAPQPAPVPALQMAPRSPDDTPLAHVGNARPVGRPASRAASVGFDLRRIPPDARRLSSAVGRRVSTAFRVDAHVLAQLRSPAKSPVRVSSTGGDRTAQTGDIAALLQGTA